MSITVTPHWSGDREWIVRAGGRYLGVVLYYPEPIIYRALAHARRPVTRFETFDDAVAWLAGDPS